MAVDIGPKIGIEGESEFRKSIQQINTSLKTLATESKMVASSFDEETTAEEKAAKQAEVLNKQIDAQKQKLQLLQEGLAKSAEKYGENDERTQKWQQAVNNAQTDLNKMESELKKTTSATDKLGDEVKDSDDKLKDMKGDTDKTTAAMQEAEKETKSWGDVMKGSLAAEAVKAGLTKLVELTKEAAKALKDCAEAGAVYGDEMITLSQQTGLSTKTLQEYNYMSGLVDVSVETITGSMTKLEKSMKSATKGSGDAYTAYKKLGVSVTDANGKYRKAEDVFNDVVKALGNVTDQTERDTMAMTLMGKSAKELNPLIEIGADKLEEYKKEAEKVGYVLNEKDLKALQNARDAMDRLDKTTEGLKNQFSIGLAPALEEANTKLTEKLTDPKVQHAIESISEAVGETLVKAIEVASGAIDDIISVMELFTGSTYTMDEDMEGLIKTTQDLCDTSDDLANTYEKNAGAINTEKQRIQDLWKDLQTLADETGNVRAEDEERAKLLLGDLNTALGTEYEMTGLQIERYQEMQGEIEGLIEKKTALALLEAYESQYTNAMTNRTAATESRISLEKEWKQAKLEMQGAQSAYDKLKETYDGMLVIDPRKIFTKFELNDKKSYLDQKREEFDAVEQSYNDALKLEDTYTKSVSTYEKAREQIYNQEYEAGINTLSMSSSELEDFSTKTGEITYADTVALNDSINTRQQMIDEYRTRFAAGEAGITQDHIDELQKRQDEDLKVQMALETGAQTWEEVSERVANTTVEHSDRIATSFETGTGEATDAVSMLRDAIKNDMQPDVSASMDKMADSAETAGSDMETAMSGARTDMNNTVDGMASDLSAKGSAPYGSFYQSAYGIGQNFALGTASGISDYIGNVMSKARYMISQACSAARSEAQINSPSKVTEKMGQYLGMGLVEGMDDETAAIEAASQKMAQAAMSGGYDNGWTTSGSSVWGSGSSYSTSIGGITLYVDGSGVANVDQLADKVATKLTAQIRRAQRAR